MNILFVSMLPFAAQTSATIQNKCIIKGLNQLGHNVDALTLQPSEDALSFDPSMNDVGEWLGNCYFLEPSFIYNALRAKKHHAEESNLAYTDDLTESVRKGFMSTIRAAVKSVYDAVSIIDPQQYNVRSVSKLDIEYERYGVVISSSDPKSSHLIAEFIFKYHEKGNTKWIQYWGDPMLIDITRKSDWRDPFVKNRERGLISKADRIVYASPLTLVAQKSLYPEYSYKMDYANQACSVSLKSQGNRKHEPKEIVTVGYFGSYPSSIRNIQPLYNAALSGSFRLIIGGSSDLHLEEAKNIAVLGPMPYSTTLEFERQVDILVCICNNRGTQIPAKIYYCAGYPKPIIVILDGEHRAELRSFLDTFGRFILCDNNEDSIIRAIQRASKEISTLRDYNVPEELTPRHMASRILGT